LQAGGHVGHFVREKIKDAVENLFYWPSLKKNITKLMRQYRTYQLAKQRK